MSRHLLAAGLVLVAALPARAGEHVRLERDVVPLRQAVSLRLDPRGESYTGSVRIELDVRRPSSRVRLHAQEMTIRSATLDGVAATSAAGPDDTLDFTATRPLAPGPASLEIEFANEYDRRAVGLYKMDRDQGYLYTQFQAIDARKAFPCFDEPGFKIPWQVTLEIPEDFDAVSNTPIAEQSSGNGWRRIAFAPTKPLPSYLVALAVGQFDYVPLEGLGVPGRIVTVKGQKHLASLASRVVPPLLRALEVYFAQPYPYEKLDLIAIPEFWPGAMENPGAITFADNVLLVDEKIVTPAERRRLARITAHELAHQWFGDLVTMTWWDDFWLNETFADWLGDKITEDVDPGLGVAVSELGPLQQTMLGDSRGTATAIRRPIEDPEEAMRTVVLAYNKGKTVLGMFERWMGPARFREGVRAYLRENAWKNTVSAQFWATLDRAAGGETSSALATFIEQPGVPLVTLERQGVNRVRLAQRRFSLAGSTLPAQSWRIPVGIRWSDGSRSHVETVLLDAASKLVTLPSPKVAWAFPNADAAGYYRWDVPPADLLDLASHAAERMTTAERVGLLGNLAALIDAGEVDGREFLEVVGRLGGDPEPEVVEAAIEALRRLEVPFVTDGNRPAFAAYVRRAFGPALDRIGLEPRAGEADEVTNARPVILGWVGDQGGDEGVLRYAREAAARQAKDPSAVAASIAGTVLRLNALSGDVALFEAYRARFEAAASPAERSLYLNGISGFRDPEVRAKILDWAASANLRLNEMFGVSLALRRSPSERDMVFDWLTRNFATISGRVPPQFKGALANFAGGCERERVVRADAFFKTQDVPNAEEEIARVSEQVEECVALRTREEQAVGAYLRASSS